MKTVSLWNEQLRAIRSLRLFIGVADGTLMPAGNQCQVGSAQALLVQAARCAPFLCRALCSQHAWQAADSAHL